MISCALLSFVGGALISLLNYNLSKYLLKHKPGLYTIFSVVRQLLNIGYLIILYFVAPIISIDSLPLLVGGVLGVTLPTIFFTFKLVKLSSSLPDGKTPDNTSDNTSDKSEGDV